MVESQTRTSPARRRARPRRARRRPRAGGRSTPTSRRRAASPHWSSTSQTRSRVASGSRPSELPSRYSGPSWSIAKRSRNGASGSAASSASACARSVTATRAPPARAGCRVDVAHVLLAGLLVQDDVSPAARAAAANSREISAGRSRRRRRVTTSAGTPSGSRSRGDAAARRRALVRRAVQQLRDHAVGEAELVGELEVEHAGLGDHAGQRHARALARGRPRREVPAGASARSRRRGRRGRAPSTSASASIAGGTSSSVAGQPPPLPSRRYSRFQAAQPRAARSSPSAVHQRAVVAVAPEPAVEEHRDAGRPSPAASTRRTATAVVVR